MFQCISSVPSFFIIILAIGPFFTVARSITHHTFNTGYVCAVTMFVQEYSLHALAISTLVTLVFDTNATPAERKGWIL